MEIIRLVCNKASYFTVVFFNVYGVILNAWRVVVYVCIHFFLRFRSS